MTLSDPCLIVEAEVSTISYISCTAEQHVYAYDVHCALNTQKTFEKLVLLSRKSVSDSYRDNIVLWCIKSPTN